MNYKRQKGADVRYPQSMDDRVITVIPYDINKGSSSEGYLVRYNVPEDREFSW